MATEKQRKAFSQKYAILASNTGQSLGVAPSIVLGQASLESDFGLSYLATAFNNFFGVKAGKDWKGKTVELPTPEEVDGKMVVQNQTFRVYDKPEDSFSDYKNVLGQERYKNLVGVKYQEAAQLLHSDGYATDSNYGTKLIQRIQDNQYQYNDIVIDPSKMTGFQGQDTVIGSTFRAFGETTNDNAYKREAELNPPVKLPDFGDIIGTVKAAIFNKIIVIVIVAVLVFVIILAIAKMTGADETIKEGAKTAAKVAVLA